MKPLHLSAIARMTGGRLHGGDVVVDAIATDTRALPAAVPHPNPPPQAGEGGMRGTTLAGEGGVRSTVPLPPPLAGQGRGVGALFVALKGERFDGHEHVAAAAQRGCVAAMVAREIDAPIPQLVVADTQRALADFAAAIQRERRGVKVVAITGSNGKTSVKAFVQTILEGAGDTYATPGNRNNEVGMPLAVLDAPEDAQFAIYEMGTGAPGDIAYLTRIAPPDVALINNVAPAHLERMGSLLNIADTKVAVFDDLRDGGVAVINADDAFAPFFAQRAHGRTIIRFGLEHSADVSAGDIRGGADGSRFTLLTPKGEAAVAIRMPGRHNVRNALAAASVALGLGVPLATIVDGLGATQPVKGRLVSHVLSSGAVLIDDSYNANPGSLAVAIEALAEASRSETGGNGEGWLVLGDMRELGDDAAQMHAEMGRRAKAAGLRRLYALGPLSAEAAKAFGDGATQYDDHDALATALRADLLQADALRASPQRGVRVLVKGSRGSAMDKIVKAVLGASDEARSDAAGGGDCGEERPAGQGNTDAA